MRTPPQLPYDSAMEDIFAKWLTLSNLKSAGLPGSVRAKGWVTINGAHILIGGDSGGGGGGGGAGAIKARKKMGDIPITAGMLTDLKGSAAHPSIAAKHLTADGKFTPERQALHDKIVNDSLKGLPISKNKTFHILGGGPASGKSVFVKMKGSGMPKDGTAAMINSDLIKEKLPEVTAMHKAGDKSWAAASHEESSYLAQRIQKAAMERGHKVVLDGTGDSGEAKLAAKIDLGHQAGYKVEGHYVTVPTDVALKRAAARAADPTSDSFGRVVNSDIIRHTHAAVSAVLPKIADRFDKVSLYDTNTAMGSAPRLLMSSTKGSGVVVHDQGGYQSFLDKGKTAMTKSAQDVTSELTVEDINKIIYAAVLGGTPQSYGVTQTPQVMQMYESILQNVKDGETVMPIRE